MILLRWHFLHKKTRLIQKIILGANFFIFCKKVIFYRTYLFLNIKTYADKEFIGVFYKLIC